MCSIPDINVDGMHDWFGVDSEHDTVTIHNAAGTGWLVLQLTSLKYKNTEYEIKYFEQNCILAVFNE